MNFRDTKIVRRVGAYPLLIGMAFGLLACSGVIPHVSSTDQTIAERTWHNVNLSHGRRVYILNCGACHSLHSPADHTPTQWQSLFGKMAGNAHLSSSDSTDVLAYLITASRTLAAITDTTNSKVRLNN